MILPGAATVQSGAALPSGAGIINVVDANGRVVAVRQVRQFSLINKALSSGSIVDSPGTVLSPFGEIDFKTSGGRDSYNSLQVGLNRRFTAGLMLGAQYQWGYSIGNTQGSNDARTAQDPFTFNGERGNNTFDIRHSANITALYELPIGNGRALNLDGVANTLLGGWTLGGVYNGRTGTPLDIRITRPDVVMVCTSPTQTGATCASGEVRGLPGTISATSPLPAGFSAVINTPGGNNTRNTRRPDIIQGVNPYLESGGLEVHQPGGIHHPASGHLRQPHERRTLRTDFPSVRYDSPEEVPDHREGCFRVPYRGLQSLQPLELCQPTGDSAEQPGQHSSQGQPFTYTSETANNVGNFGLINATVGRTVGLGTNRQIQFSGRISF